MTNQKKALVTDIPFGHFSFKGVLLNDGTFAVAFPQVYELFSLPQKNGSRKLKALLGKEQLLPQKVQVEAQVYKRAVDVLTLDEFDIVVGELAYAGNEQARNFDRMLRRLQLEQLFCDAFDIRFEKEERQVWLKERQTGKFYRRTFTDAVKYLNDRNIRINYGYVTLRVYEACLLKHAYLAYKDSIGDAKFRNTLDDIQLRRVAKMEELTADYIIVDNMTMEDALEKQLDISDKGYYN